jgi:hypothetical protein
MRLIYRLRSLPSCLTWLLAYSVCLILPERILDADPPWWRRYDHWPKP